MFTNISWTDYIAAVALLLAIYYLFIALRFYTQELKNIFLKGQIQLGVVSNEAPGKTRSHSKPIHGPSQDSFAEDPNESFQEVENLISRLKITIEEGARNQLLKQGFSQNIKLVLKEYPSLKNSTFKAAINELIISECEKYGSTILDEDEVAVMWDSV